MISLSELTRWLAGRAEDAGVDIFPGFAGEYTAYIYAQTYCAVSLQLHNNDLSECTAAPPAAATPSLRTPDLTPVALPTPPHSVRLSLPSRTLLLALFHPLLSLLSPGPYSLRQARMCCTAATAQSQASPPTTLAWRATARERPTSRRASTCGRGLRCLQKAAAAASAR